MRKAIVVLFAVVALVIGGGFLLPASLSVERTRTMPCPPEKVFLQLNEMSNWTNWSVWKEMEPDMKVVTTGPAAGVGARQEWSSKNSGSGYQEITASIENRELRSRLFFLDYNSGAESVFRLSASGNSGTVVRWGFVGDPVRNPFMRYINAVLVRGQLAGYFDRGLELLEQAACSNRPKAG